MLSRLWIRVELASARSRKVIIIGKLSRILRLAIIITRLLLAVLIADRLALLIHLNNTGRSREPYYVCTYKATTSDVIHYYTYRCKIHVYTSSQG